MIGREATAGTAEGRAGVGARGGIPSRKGVRGYNPRENLDICDARMYILECRIGIVYGDDNMVVVGFVVKTGGEKEYE